MEKNLEICLKLKEDLGKKGDLIGTRAAAELANFWRSEIQKERTNREARLRGEV
jgi:hypothetical protein